MPPEPPPLAGRDGLPCSEFVAPAPLFAVALLALNDHVLKYTALADPWTTGKLSDLAGLFFFPLLLTATCNTTRYLAVALLRRRWPPTADYQVRRWQLALAVLATAAAFAALKLWAPVGTELAGSLEAMLPGRDFRFVADPWDLLALAMLPLSYGYGARHARRTPNPAP